jgi:hypothetical protein
MLIIIYLVLLLLDKRVGCEVLDGRVNEQFEYAVQQLMFENEFIVGGVLLLNEEADDFLTQRYGKIVLVFLVLFEPICLLLIAKALERILDRAEILPHVLNNRYHRTRQIGDNLPLVYVLKDSLGQVVAAFANKEEEAHLQVHEIKLRSIILGILLMVLLAGILEILLLFEQAILILIRV